MAAELTPKARHEIREQFGGVIRAVSSLDVFGDRAPRAEGHAQGGLGVCSELAWCTGGPHEVTEVTRGARGVQLIGMVIAFRALSEADLTQMHEWLCRAHVVEWWELPVTLDEVRADYRPRLAAQSMLPLDAPAGVTQYLACEDGVPFGFVQAYRVMAHQADGWWPHETDPCALGIDQFIGDPDRLGQGLGTRLLGAFLAFLFEDPRVTSVQTDPDPENARAIAAYRKSGFRDVGLVDTLDGPVLLMKTERHEVSR